MSTITHPLLPLPEHPGMADAISSVVAKSSGLICVTCGLERMGHGPESSWLGYEAHEWQGVPGDAEAAEALSRKAYRARCARNLCGAYCQSTH